jgi:hypothetical protein
VRFLNRYFQKPTPAENTWESGRFPREGRVKTVVKTVGNACLDGLIFWWQFWWQLVLLFRATGCTSRALVPCLAA